MVRPLRSRCVLLFGTVVLLGVAPWRTTALAQGAVADRVPGPASTASARLVGAARLADSVRVLAERAYLAGDTAALVRAHALTQRALLVFPDDPLLLHYQGYIRFRQAQRLPQFEQRLPLFEDAVALLERSAAIRPLPETYALLASATGSMIGDSMLRGIRFGMRASDAEERATALAAGNPRVLLLRAVSAWYKPSAFGGGEEKARSLLQQAIRMFATDAPARPLPSWGHAEAYAWLGQMELKAGRREAARAAFEQALTIAPGYAWVQHVLLPAVDGRQ